MFLYGRGPVKHYDDNTIKYNVFNYRCFMFVVSSPCSKNNAGCQHMCIVTRGSDGLLAHRCACNMGYQLAQDMHNCVCEYIICL